MKNLKFYLLNVASVTLFSYILAVTISHFIRLSITPVYASVPEKKINVVQKAGKKSFNDYSSILDATFFKIADANGGAGAGDTEIFVSSDLKELKLLGTISGPSSIARALIRKRTEKESQIFKLWNDVYGFKLVRIDTTKVYLKKGETTEILDSYAADEQPNNNMASRPPVPNIPAEGARSSYSISRSEIQQKISNVDNAMQGLRAGPFRVNDNIEGYKLFRVSPSNILYKYGLRSGDIVKRVNGHALDSTEKLFSLWEAVKGGESKATVDFERGGRIQSIDINITD